MEMNSSSRSRRILFVVLIPSSALPICVNHVEFYIGNLIRLIKHNVICDSIELGVHPINLIVMCLH